MLCSKCGGLGSNSVSSHIGSPGIINVDGNAVVPPNKETIYEITDSSREDEEEKRNYMNSTTIPVYDGSFKS